MQLCKEVDTPRRHTESLALAQGKDGRFQERGPLLVAIHGLQKGLRGGSSM